MFINVCHERIRLGGSSVRTHERTSLRLGCGLVRGRHKARPLQLMCMWCGRSNEPNDDVRA
ncbi:MAG: hypothetical protein SPL43_05605 [Prevotella sp.]|nr:hypothetical protein [Prevotella sp.]